VVLEVKPGGVVNSTIFDSLDLFQASIKAMPRLSRIRKEEDAKENSQDSDEKWTPHHRDDVYGGMLIVM
jgi:hypothetical protein